MKCQHSNLFTLSYQLCYIRNKEFNNEIVLFVIFQMEELVDQGNVYSGDDWRFFRYCLLWSARFDLVGEFRPYSLIDSLDFHAGYEDTRSNYEGAIIASNTSDMVSYLEFEKKLTDSGYMVPPNTKIFLHSL